MKTMNHKYMHLGALADAYNSMNGLSPRSKSSGMFIARSAVGLSGNVKSATHEQMDEMIAFLKGRLPHGLVIEPDDGRHKNPGRRRIHNTIRAAQKASKQSQAKWFKNRYAKDPIFALRHSMRRTVATALKRAGFVKNQSSIKIVGCTAAELKKHIELQFLPGMSWANRESWHIDHIVPLSSAKTEDELLALCHFTNLRPLWAKENQKKSSQMTHLL